jgi:4-hydroxy-3-methylbut-2-enyl diphosphate reductase
MKVLLANPRGFCAGVDRAIEIVERALDLLGAPVYVRHEVVHNRTVVTQLQQRGAIFVDELDEIPDGNTVIFSAHGVSQTVRLAAEARNLQVFDATCPLVTKVHLEVARQCQAGHDVILIGHAGHPEVEGTLGQYRSSAQKHIYLVETPDDVARLQVSQPDKLSFVTQTTLSVDDTAQIIQALRTRFPSIQGPRKDDICYATQNRQDAVRQLATQCNIVLVVGSPNSSNSNRLKELAEQQGCTAYLIEDAADIQPNWLVGCDTVGLTAGASAPEEVVQQVLTQLRAHGAGEVIQMHGKTEQVVFSLPQALRSTDLPDS